MADKIETIQHEAMRLRYWLWEHHPLIYEQFMSKQIRELEE